MQKYNLADQNKIQDSVIFLCKKFSDITDDLDKPVVLHSIRVGAFLYDNGYPVDIVIAGYLHDIIEDTSASKEMIEKKFGSKVADIVQANTKTVSILENTTRREELIKQVLASGENAAIVKAADIIDNYRYYSNYLNKDGVEYCRMNIKFFQKYFRQTYRDTIFVKLFSLLK